MGTRILEPNNASNWKRVKVGDVASLGRGRVISQREIGASRTPQYPVYSSQTSNQGLMGYLDTYDFEGEYITWTTDGVNAGTVFHRSGKFNCTNVCGIIKLYKDDHRFIAYALDRVTDEYVSKHLANPKLMNDVMKQVSLYIPTSIEEQKAIAQALGDVDELIASLDALIAKQRAIKQAAMQRLLTGQQRLPGFTGDWEVKRLGEVADFSKGKGLSKADLVKDGSQPCIHYGELFTTYREKIERIIHATNKDGNFVLSRDNDVLMPTSDVTPNGLATASCIRQDDVVLGGDILIIRTPEETLDGEFLAYSIKINRKQVMQLVTGTTVFHLYGKDMCRFTFAVPNYCEQRAIAEVLSDMDRAIDTLTARREKTVLLKQGMMQELLTGRTRLINS